LPGAINKKNKEEDKMEQKRVQETRKQEKPFDILDQDAMSFIRGGDGDPPVPPPVENGDDE
jgi:hypothetical protein